MAEVIKKRRWIMPLLIVAAVIAVSVALILTFRRAPAALSVQAVSDGKGGAIVAWQDEHGIRAQRINASGQSLWGEGSLLVQKIATRFDPYAPSHAFFALTADGTGGAIVTWENRYTYPSAPDSAPIDAYSQRITADGKLLWGDGVITGKVQPIASSSVGWVVPDGTGGAIFGWNDYKTYFRGLHDDFLRLQKVSPDGRLLWGTEGVLVTASSPYRPLTEEEKARGIQGTVGRSWPTYTGYQVVVSDGAQGAIAVWHEEDYDNRMFRIYARRVDREGSFAWPEPVLLSAARDFPYFTSITCGADADNGLVALAVPGAGGGGLTTFMCFDRDGKTLWQKSMAARMNYSTDEMVGDGLGGIISSRTEASPPIGPPSERSISLFLQRLGREGNALWTERPVITTEKGQSFDVDIVRDGTGGAILVWRLAEMEQNAYGKLFSQRLNAEGNAIWDKGGLTIFPDPKLKYQGIPGVISTDSGAIVIAAVGRGALQGDMIYAQKLDAGGNRLWGDGIRIDQ